MASQTVTQRTADVVAAAILRSGIARHRVAIETGIAETTLRRKLQGVAPFNVEDLALIARVLGVPYSSLLPAELTDCVAA